MKAKRKVESEEMRMICEVPTGEFVRLATKSGRVFARVYKLEGFDRSERAYWLQAADDISDGRYVKGIQPCQVGFTY